MRVHMYTPILYTFQNLGNIPVLHVTNFYLKDKLSHYELPKLVQPGKMAIIFTEWVYTFLPGLGGIRWGWYSSLPRKAYMYISKCLLMNLSVSIPQKNYSCSNEKETLICDTFSTFKVQVFVLSPLGISEIKVKH